MSSDSTTVVDCTFGGGGHSLEILSRYPNAKIIAIDQDNGVWERAKEKFKGMEDRITFVNGNFRDLDEISPLPKNFDGIIFDLGLSSDQLENSGRGFSFMKDEPLLMTMKENPGAEDLTASDVVNAWSEESLADIIYGYGEERYARKIAKKIAEARQDGEIKTTFDLVKIIEGAVLKGREAQCQRRALTNKQHRRGKIHPATKTFQALRIAVNDELGVLKEGLRKGFEELKAGGRMSVISFHSLEDRIIKKFFKTLQKEGKAKLINKKTIKASEEELRNNPRSRSAKLRILEKIK